MAIPKRTLLATCEIDSGTLEITQRPPAFTGESDALVVQVSLTSGGEPYTIEEGVDAGIYLYWPGTHLMTDLVTMVQSGSQVTGVLSEALTAMSGCPLLVLRLQDTATGAVIVACAAPIQITNVLGETVITTRPPTPSEIIYVGRSPYVNTTTGTWMQWSTETGDYIDTGITAKGDKGDPGDPLGATAENIPMATGSSKMIAQAISERVKTVNNIGPDAAGNVSVQAGVTSVNGKVDDVTLTATDIPTTAVTGQTEVGGALGELAGRIDGLGATAWQIVVEDNTFVMYWAGASASSPITIAQEGTDYVAYIAE